MLLEVLTGVHWEMRYELKKTSFLLKSVIKLSLKRRWYNFLLLSKLLMMGQYDLTDVFEPSSFTLSPFTNLSLVSISISEQYFEYWFSYSLLIIDGFVKYFFKSLELFFKASKISEAIYFGFLKSIFILSLGM